MKISTFSVSQKNLCFDQTFSQTHRQTQWMHSWIGLGLRNVKKLVPGQTNSGILSYDNFSGQKIRKTCMRAANRQPMFTARGTRRAFSFFLRVFCSITSVWNGNRKSWTTTTKQLHNPKRCQTCKKVEIFEMFVFNVNHPKMAYCNLQNIPGPCLGILEASWKLLRHFREKSIFHENLDFFGVMKKTFACRELSLDQ